MKTNQNKKPIGLDEGDGGLEAFGIIENVAGTVFKIILAAGAIAALALIIRKRLKKSKQR
ncbi:MAG: hypothetical protein FWD15_05180 [Alphaproteobacteria bacterium]|nr:hypothetical protein [Alphaproteobacteria bacterium]